MAACPSLTTGGISGDSPTPTTGSPSGTEWGVEFPTTPDPGATTAPEPTPGGEGVVGTGAYCCAAATVAPLSNAKVTNNWVRISHPKNVCVDDPDPPWHGARGTTSLVAQMDLSERLAQIIHSIFQERPNEDERELLRVREADLEKASHPTLSANGPEGGVCVG